MTNEKFCHACGSQLHIDAELCPKCGVRQHKMKVIDPNASDKKILIAFLLSFFLGVLGLHRFYVGRNRSAIVMLILSLTVVGLVVTSIWNLIDWIIIVCGNFQDAKGKTLQEWT